MLRKFINSKNSSGMTLVEVLTAMLILGIIIIAIFPLITQSLQATNLSHTVSSQLFGEQGEIEIVAVTEEGAVLADGTFISIKKFPVFNDVTWVVGNRVKKADLVRFLASNQVISYNLFERYEGYNEEEAIITIKDKSLVAGSTLKITDKNGYLVTITEKNITPGKDITFKLPSDSNRLTNIDSPYTITVNTPVNGDEDAIKKSGLLLIHLPRAVIAKDNGGLLIASSPDPENWFVGGSSNWVARSSSIEDANDIKKIISIGTADSEARFIAIGKNGGIYSWENGGTVFEPLTSGVSTNLNDIIAAGHGLLAVGNNGVILQSEDGETWTKIDSGTTANLNAITYNSSTERYVCACSNGILLTSADGAAWTALSYPTTGTINDKGAVTFSSSGDYLKTDSNPVANKNTYTVFMVVQPASNPENVSLLSLGNDTSSFTLRTSGTNLAAEIKSGTTTSSLSSTTNALESGQKAIIACRVSGSNMKLYKNGSEIKSTDNITNVSLPDGGVMKLGNFSLTSSTPNPFHGSIAEVMVFNSDLGIDGGYYQGLFAKYYFASQMDLVHKYLSLKYNIGIGAINNLYYKDSTSSRVNKLSNFSSNGHWRSSGCWPYGTSNYYHKNYPMDPILWLDIWSYYEKNTLSLGGTQVLTWKNTAKEDVNIAENTGCDIDNSFPLNLAAANMKSVACNDNNDLYVGGVHVHLRKFNGSSITRDINNLNGSTGNAVQYSIDDMIFAHDRFIALLNDEEGGSNKYIATLDRPENYTDIKIASSNTLNDIFHYTPSDTLLVVGNNGTVYYSGDGVNWTNKTLSGNLVAGCIR